jgi:hypothetical protein
MGPNLVKQMCACALLYSYDYNDREALRLAASTALYVERPCGVLPS